jgi:tetrahydromethanopterin S-methyltransferase subunit B
MAHTTATSPVDERIAHIEGTVQQMDKRLDDFAGRLDGIDRRLDGIEAKFNWVIGLILTSWVTIVALLVTVVLKIG